MKRITFEKGVRPTDLSYFAYGCDSLSVVSEIPDSVIKMEGTFRECTELETAPEIPNSVIIMLHTFTQCISLKAAPDIPNSVKDMSSTFSQCHLLQGEMVINAGNINSYTNCFRDAALGGQLILNYGPGAQETVHNLLEIKSLNSKIVMGAEKNTNH